MDFTKYSFAVEVPLEEDADEALLETKTAVIEPIFVDEQKTHNPFIGTFIAIDDPNWVLKYLVQTKCRMVCDADINAPFKSDKAKVAQFGTFVENLAIL